MTIEDTGESIIGHWGEGFSRIVRHYNPVGGQNLGLGERDEAIGEIFALLADVFDKRV